MGITSWLKNWAAHPFNSDGSWIDWLLFLGLIMVGVVLWSRIIAAQKVI